LRAEGNSSPERYIIRRIWGKDVFLDADNTINSAIRKIRQVLNDDPEKPAFVQTSRGKGIGSSQRLLRAVFRLSKVASATAGPKRRKSSPVKSFSHYRIEEESASGGRGAVFQGEDIRLGGRVAIKFLSEKPAGDSHALQRFLLEARAASSLNHPNVCTIYEIGE
jgi:serine/threonine protein kinase